MYLSGAASGGGEAMIDQDLARAIREEFLAGTLKVRSVSPETGEVSESVVSDVMEHQTDHKEMVCVALVGGLSVVCTEDHSLFLRQGDCLVAVEGSSIEPGMPLAVVFDGTLREVEVASVERLEPQEHTYDLCVPGDQNFVLTNGVVAHNSYSIGGISLDIEKSSKYQSLKNQAEAHFEKGATEVKIQTTKLLRGLQQPRFGIGIRSSFGPAVGRGVLSPRSFL